MLTIFMLVEPLSRIALTNDWALVNVISTTA